MENIGFSVVGVRVRGGGRDGSFGRRGGISDLGLHDGKPGVGAQGALRRAGSFPAQVLKLLAHHGLITTE